VPEVKNELCDKVHRLDIHSTFTNSTVSLFFSLGPPFLLSLIPSVSLSVGPPVACSYVVAHSQISHTHNTQSHTARGRVGTESEESGEAAGRLAVDSVCVREKTQEAAGMQSIHFPLFLCQCVCVRVICTVSFKFLRGLHAYIRC
jgi:hypothetical protein